MSAFVDALEPNILAATWPIRVDRGWVRVINDLDGRRALVRLGEVTRLNLDTKEFEVEMSGELVGVLTVQVRATLRGDDTEYGDSGWIVCEYELEASADVQKVWDALPTHMTETGAAS